LYYEKSDIHIITQKIHETNLVEKTKHHMVLKTDKKKKKKKKTDILRLINHSSPTPQPLMLPQYPLCCSPVFYFQSRLVSTAIFNNLSHSLSLTHSVSDAQCHKQKDKKNPNTHLHFMAAATSTTTTSTKLKPQTQPTKPKRRKYQLYS
jgi:hypothetical protein